MRNEWIQLRLNNWALWKARQAGGGLGYASESALLHIVSTDRYREAKLPIDDNDATQMNAAVESLRAEKLDLYETLYCIYVWDMGIKGTARHFNRAESTIKARLGHADLMLKLWFDDQKLKKKSFTP